MGLKQRYSRTRPPPRTWKGLAERTPAGFFANRGEETGKARCSCWILVRGEGPQCADRDSADCELVPDPSCPVHGRKRIPILDDLD